MKKKEFNKCYLYISKNKYNLKMDDLLNSKLDPLVKELKTLQIEV